MSSCYLLKPQAGFMKTSRPEMSSVEADVGWGIIPRYAIT